jgi:aminopeptidase N
MTVTEITRDETRQRAELLSIDSYEVSLDHTRGPETFGSHSVIRFSCQRPGAATYVDLVAVTVHEIILNGRHLDPATALRGGRIALDDLAARNELRITADCRYSGDGTGLQRCADSADGRVYTYTKFEPAYARQVFANFEQPDLKAPFTFHVTVPAAWTVLSNQPSSGREPVPGGDATVWHFPPTPRISTYLTAVVAGEYEVVTSRHETPRGQVIPLVLACRASLAAALDTADILTVTGQGLDFYTELFHGDFPFDQYGQVFVPEYSAGATENVGCVVFTDQMLFPSKVTDAMYELRAMMILHEMAHMWFGDLVTMKWWDDLWLNESFAEFGGTLSSAEGSRFTDAWATFSIGRKTWAYQQDQLPSAHPVAANVPTLSQAVANFDGISYAKGAAVVQQLAAKVGREAFFAGIRAYFAEHAFGNATLADLLRTLEASSGVPLAEWSRAWLETAGPNVLRAELVTDENGVLTSAAIVQEASVVAGTAVAGTAVAGTPVAGTAVAGTPVYRPHHIAVGLYDRAADGSLKRRHRVEVDVTGARTEVPGLAGQRQGDLVLVNDDDLGYAIIRFDPRSLRTLAESIGGLPEPLTRAVCWTALIDMTRQAELPLPEFIAIVATGMGQESSQSILQVLHSVSAQLLAQSGDPRRAAAAKGELAAAAARLLLAAAPGSDHQLAWAQLLSWTATTAEQLDLVAGLLGGDVELPGLTVSTDLRWALLRRLAALSRAGDPQIDAELARDPTDAGRRYALSCRAAVPDAAHKEAAWRLLAESDELGVAGVIEVIRGFALAEHAGLLAPYTERYFAALPVIWATRGEHFRVLLGGELFPFAAAAPDLSEQVDVFLAAGERDPALVRMLVELRATAQRARQSRALGAS